MIQVAPQPANCRWGKLLDETTLRSRDGTPLAEEKTPEEHNETEPALCAREDFEAVVQALVDMLQRGIASFRLSTGLPIRLRIDDERFAEFEDELPLERPAFLRIAGTEITSLLVAALADEPERALLHVIPDEILKRDGAMEELQARLALVRERLVSKSLRERVLIHRTTKNEVLRGWDWDISVKRHDLVAGTIGQSLSLTFPTPHSLCLTDGIWTCGSGSQKDGRPGGLSKGNVGSLLPGRKIGRCGMR